MKRLPTALVVGLAIQLVFDTARIVHWLTVTDPELWQRWELLESGVDIATAGLMAAGLFELARGLRDRAALGARIAAWAEVGQLVLAGFWIAAAMWSASVHKGVRILEDFALVSRYAQSIITLAAAAGIAIAMRNAVLGIIAVVVAAVGVPLPVIGDLYQKTFHFGNTAGIVMSMGPYVLLSALALGQLWLGADAVALPPSGVPANMAFTSASKALWLRLIAAVSLAGITFLAALASGQGEGLLGLLKAVTMLAPIVDAFALAMFARAVLQLSRTQIAPWLTAAAAACALFATGAMAGHFSATYQLLYGGDHDRYPYGGHDHVTGLYMTLVPLVSGAGIALVLMAVAKLARTRNRDDVRENVAVRTGVFVALTLGVLFVVNYGLPKVDSEGLAIFALLAIACASLYSLSLAAKICTQAAELIERDPMGLPAATLVKGGDA